ncbi:hypothetical protein L7F22_064833 [Adiantum nelumboides]|nr:hypothetical protein [Adiantum nelumboides]
MIHQLGPPTFFVTLSCAEKRWQPLKQCLAALNPDIALVEEHSNSTTTQKLVRSNPITTAQYYVHQFQALKKELKKNKELIGQVEDFVFVTEFQHRGSQHDHGLIWIKDAPCHGQARDEELVRFIDSTISVDRHQLPEPLRDVQTHSHRKTCKRKRTECRFGFPRPPANKTMILYPLEEDNVEFFQHHRAQHKILTEELGKLQRDNNVSFQEWLTKLSMCEETYIEVLRASITEATLVLKREPKDIYTNNFNIGISNLWDANKDIQYVFNAFAAASYCTSYMTNNDTAASKAVQAILQQNKENGSPTIERLRSLGNALINTQELSSQQAAYIALSLPLHSCSRQFQFLNTNFAAEQTLMLKRKAQLERLQAEDTNIFFDDIITKYAKRPRTLHALCLAEFASQYKLQGGHHKKMKRCKVIRSINYSVAKDPEKYYHEMCLLYVPFTHEENKLLVGQTTTWKDVFDTHIQDIVLRSAQFTKVPHLLSINTAKKSSSQSSSSSSAIEMRHAYDTGVDMPLKKTKASVHTQ